MALKNITLTVNELVETVDVPHNMTLLQMLRISFPLQEQKMVALLVNVVLVQC